MNRMENLNTDRRPKTLEETKVEVRDLGLEIMSRTFVRKRLISKQWSVRHRRASHSSAIFLPPHFLTFLSIAHALVQGQQYAFSSFVVYITS